MSDRHPLALLLANTALQAAHQPIAAVTALMTAAATILHRDLGPEGAADAMLRMAVEAHAAFATAGLVVEPTSH